MTIAEIYCPDCDYEYATVGEDRKPPACPKCGCKSTRHAGRVEEVNPESCQGLMVLWGARG